MPTHQIDIYKNSVYLDQCHDYGRTELRQLMGWLYRDRSWPSKGEYRIAQSPLIRSELEMLGLSAPRFALRLLLDRLGQPYSWIGLRRSEQMENQDPETITSTKFSELYEEFKEFYEDPIKDFDKVISRSSGIADCVLARPQSLDQSDYTLLQSNLGLVYGESRDLRGTPYMKHIRLGGGLCAQAACFMCSMLMIEYARSIDGPVEISAKAMELRPGGAETPKTPRLLPINGLNTDAICHYYNRTKNDEAIRLWWDIHRKYGDNTNNTKPTLDKSQLPTETGLRAHEQVVNAKPNPYDGYFERDPDRQDGVSGPWNLSLDSYIASGMPVIMSLDCGRMHKLCSKQFEDLVYPSIYRTNNITEYLGELPFEYSDQVDQPHATVVVGRHNNNATRPWRHCEYVINDPASLPFLTASGQQLYFSGEGNLVQEKEGVKKKHAFIKERRLIAITPERAKMPLLGNRSSAARRDLKNPEWVVDRDIEYHVRGLDEYADSFWKERKKEEQGLVYEGCVDPRELPKVYRLIEVTRRFNSEKTSEVLKELESNHGLSADIYHRLRTLLRWSGIWTRWMWLELRYTPHPKDKQNTKKGGAGRLGQWQHLNVWDAEQEPHAHWYDKKHNTQDFNRDRGHREPQYYLFRRFVRIEDGYSEKPGGSKWTPGKPYDRRATRRRSRREGQDKPANDLQLQPSLITSCNTQGFSKTLKDWRSHYSAEGQPTIGCELYAFMQTEHDLNLIHRPAKGESDRVTRERNKQASAITIDKPVTEWLEQLNQSSGLCRRVASNIVGHLEEQFEDESVRPKLVALATFVPEVSYPIKTKSHSRACEAMQALAKIAIELRELKQPVRVIEAVGGSRLTGAPIRLKTQKVAPAADNRRNKPRRTEPDHDFYCLSPHIEDMLKAVGAAFKPACQTISESPASEALRFALELEPGAVFVLAGLDGLKRFANQASNDPLLNKYMGFNLDIGHWMLARIDPERLRTDHPEVLDRVVHAHFSGVSSCGHIADTHPLDLNVLPDYSPWISLLQERLNDDRAETMPYSGHLSLELESAATTEQVTSSLSTLRELLSPNQVALAT